MILLCRIDTMGEIISDIIDLGKLRIIALFYSILFDPTIK